jgi:iron(III) transport system permease protein
MSVAVGTGVDVGSAARAAPRRLFTEKRIAGLLVAALAAFLIVAIALPLWALLSKSFLNARGEFVGLANYGAYFANPILVDSLFNSIFVAVVSTAIVIPLAFTYAYALTRTCLPFKSFFYALALLPLFAPSLLSALSLVYIFGNQGFLRWLMFGHTIYGPIGIIIAQVTYTFPHAVLILVTALALSDGRLYEVAEALGTSKRRIFWTVTLPGAQYGLISASFVVFTLVITDFGIPKVIGGQFNVLATDAYRAVVGQQNFEMGAVVGMILLVPAVTAFLVDRLVNRRQVALLSSRAVPYEPTPSRARDLGFIAYCLLVGALVTFTLGVAVWASFIQYWPYNLSFTLSNYNFDRFEPQGWSPYFTSVKMAFFASVIGTAIIFTGAYLIEKTNAFPIGRAIAHFLAMMPVAVPGLVLGLGYVFFFNAIWNPLNFLYATLAILVINTIAHFFTVSHITAMTALKQIDREFEAVSASLKIPFWKTFRRVTVPICMPAILDIAVYLFVNAMTTVSAVIFLYGAHTKLASVSIVHMDEAGFIAAAAAMATMIVATAIGVKVLHILLDRFIFGRLQAWRRR